MPDDELEHLRAILARIQVRPKKKGIFVLLYRAILGFFTRPKKFSAQGEEKKARNKDAA